MRIDAVECASQSASSNHECTRKFLGETHCVNWISGHAPHADSSTLTLSAKTRYRQKDQDCQLNLKTDGSAQVTFTEPQRAITPGQYLVLYQDDICLGGGIIEAALGGVNKSTINSPHPIH